MLLRYSPTSPYVRKVLVTALELGIRDQIELAPATVWEPDTDIRENNPLGKVPALVLDDGRTLYDSLLICEYLNSLAHPVDLFSGTGDDHWETLRFHVLADGIMDASVLCVLEGRRPDMEDQSEWWVSRQKETVQKSLDALEKDVAYLVGAPVSIAQISVAIALEWLNFCGVVGDPLEGRPGLAKWFEDFSKRPSMQETQPKMPS